MTQPSYTPPRALGPVLPEGVPGPFANAAALALASLGPGLLTLMSSQVFIQAFTPKMSRARKAALADEYLPLLIPLAALVCAIGCFLAKRRLGTVRAILVRPGPQPATRVLGAVCLVLLLAFGTPLLESLLGREPNLGASRLSESTSGLVLAFVGLLALAIQEDVFLRILPVEGCLALFAGTSRVSRRTAALAIAVSALVAAAAHAVPVAAAYELRDLVLYVLPKLAAAVVFAWVYLRRGLLESVLVHWFVNVLLLLALPALLGGPR